jgi:hemerythrin-like domain-containing protein
MKITDALLGEHAVFYAMFDHLDNTVPKIDSIDELKSLAALVARPLFGHAGLENAELFAALDPFLGGQGPLEVMRSEHEDIEGTFSHLDQIDDLEELKNELVRIMRVARDHFKKEENVLFPMANQAIGEKLESLGETWAQTRGVSLGG